MALKPTIYKARITLSDLERDYYDNLSLTLACHPSETLERMVVRLIAFCLHATQHPVFTKGLSTIEEPDLWSKTLEDSISLWIEVGEPATDRIRKACRLADTVFVYSFNSKAPVWWQQSQQKLSQLPATIVQLSWPEVQQLTKLVNRTMDMAVTLTAQSAYVSDGENSYELSWQILQQP